MPEVGEKLVCLRNDKTKGLLNGAIFRVNKASGLRRARYRMSLTAEEASGGKPIRVGVLPAFFEGARGKPVLRPAPRIRRIRLRLRADRAQGARLAMGRCRAVRRKLGLSREPRALALYRRHPGGEKPHRGGLNSAVTRRLRAEAGGARRRCRRDVAKCSGKGFIHLNVILSCLILQCNNGELRRFADARPDADDH